MHKFLKESILFLVGNIVILICLLSFVPNPITQNNILGALDDKHRMLDTVSSPRIILVGGSNLSFGLKSQILFDSLHRNVINLGLHAGLGLKFMIDDVKPFIRKNDVIILAPEYSQFYTDGFYGNIELVSVLFDVFPQGLRYINLKQWIHLMNYIPTYSAKKAKYLFGGYNLMNDPKDVYSRKSFNRFGDAINHWGLPNIKIQSARKSMNKDVVNPIIIKYLVDFRSYIKSRGASIYLFPPVYQKSSFNNQKHIINEISKKLNEVNFPFVANPSRYSLDDSLFFNTISHLDENGAEIRTQLLLQDIKSNSI